MKRVFWVLASRVDYFQSSTRTCLIYLSTILRVLLRLKIKACIKVHSKIVHTSYRSAKNYILDILISSKITCNWLFVGNKFLPLHVMHKIYDHCYNSCCNIKTHSTKVLLIKFLLIKIHLEIYIFSLTFNITLTIKILSIWSPYESTLLVSKSQILISFILDSMIANKYIDAKILFVVHSKFNQIICKASNINSKQKTVRTMKKSCYIQSK